MYIILDLVLVYLLFGEPYMERHSNVVYEKTKNQDVNAKNKTFFNAVIRVWLMGIVTFIAFIIGNETFSKLGFRKIDTHYFTQLPIAWRVIVIILIACYSIYLLAPITLPYLTNAFRDRILGMLESIIHLAPDSKRDAIGWGLVALSTPIEEIIYRGLVFFLAQHYFPNASIWVILLISIVVECIRYINKPITMMWATTSSLIFGFVYIIFDSIWLVSLLHIFHDFRVFLMPMNAVKEKMRKEGKL